MRKRSFAAAAVCAAFGLGVALVQPAATASASTDVQNTIDSALTNTGNEAPSATPLVNMPSATTPAVRLAADNSSLVADNDPNDPVVRLTSTEGTANGSAAPAALDGQLSMTLPITGNGTLLSDGLSRLYESTAPSTDVVVQPVGDSARAMFLIEDENAPNTYDFTVGGSVTRLELDDETGGIVGYDVYGNAVAFIQEPWAADADGVPVATNYSVSGTTVTQHVEHDIIRNGITAYPVVADPRITYGWGVYLNLRGWEAKAIASATYTAGATASIVACEFSKLPSPLSKIVKVLCIVVGGSSVLSIIKTVRSISRSVGDNVCLQTKVIPPNREIKQVAVKNCTG